MQHLRETYSITAQRYRHRFRPTIEPLDPRITPALFTWTNGGTSNLFSDPDNWKGGAVPDLDGTADLLFPPSSELGTGTNGLLAINDLANANETTTFQSIVFQDSYDIRDLEEFGNLFLFMEVTNSLMVETGLVQIDSQLQLPETAMVSIGTNQLTVAAVNGSGMVDVGSGVFRIDSLLETFDDPNSSFDGEITGTGDFRISNEAFVSLSATISLGGPDSDWIVGNGGTSANTCVTFSGTIAPPDGMQTPNIDVESGGFLGFAGASVPEDFVAGASSGGQWDFGQQTVSALSGGITISGNADVTINGKSKSKTSNGSVSQGNGRLVMNGEGTQIISFLDLNNGGEDTVRVMNGTLLLNGTITDNFNPAPVSIEGGMLGGTPNDTFNLTATGGMIDPGMPGEMGAFSFENLTAGPNSTFRMQIAGASEGQFDRLVIVNNFNGTSASVDAGLMIEVPDGATLTQGQTIKIVDTSSNSGTFAGRFKNLPDGATFTDTSGGYQFQIKYNSGDNTDVILTVMNTPPTITELADQEVNINTTVGPLTFTINDAESLADDLIVTAESSNTALVPNANILLGGQQKDRAVVVNPAIGQSGMAIITVTVTDPDGSSVQELFTITVNPPNAPPTISNISNQSAVQNRVIGPLAFTVNDAETPAGALSAIAVSSNPALVPINNIVFGGTGSDRTVSITPVADQSGTATITITITDGDGATATDDFTVTFTSPTINTPPDAKNDIATTAFQTAITIPVLANDFDADGDVLTIASLTNPVNGAAKFTGSQILYTPNTGFSGSDTFTYTISDGNGGSDTASVNVTVQKATSPPPTTTDRTVLVGFRQFATGADAGSSLVTLTNPDGSVRFTLTPFPGFLGGIRTASADLNGDGVADLIVGTGPGRSTQVRIFDGVTQKQLFSVDPFEASFTGGVYVSAGDVNGDGIPDLAITPDEGGGPRVDMYSGNGFAKFVSFFGIDDPNFRGGARSSIADMTGDGVGDLIVVAGFGGGPRVAGFDGNSLGNTPQKIFADFFAFEQTLRNGIFVTAGDLNGDGFADLIAGGGPGGGPRVLAFDGKSLLDNQYVNLANFFGGDPNSRGGIRLAVKDLDGDERADLVVGAGSGAGSRVTAYLGNAIAPAGTPPSVLDFDAIADFTGGVFVG